MDGQIKVTEKKEIEEEFSFKKFFVPFTTIKAVHWIIIIGLAVFFNILFNGFVWDDKLYIVNNADLRTLNIFYLFGPNSFNNGLYYRPLTAVYFSFLYAFFGIVPFFYHFFQIIVHIFNTILLFFIFKKFINKQLSFFLSLVFLVHPIQVESVAFIEASISNLSLTLGMMALLLSFRRVITIRNYIVITLFLLISLLLRETGVLFFIFILLYRILFTFEKKSIITFLSIDTAIALFYLFLRYFVGKVSLVTAKGTLVPIAGLGPIHRVENIPAIVFYYLKTFLYPAQLAIDQQWIITRLTFTNFFLPLLLDALFFLLAILFSVYLHKKHNKFYKPFVFFLLWFILALGFHVQIYPLDMTVADRFFYFPLAGLVGMIGIIGAFLETTYKNKKLHTLILVLAICIIGLLSVRTMIRNANWHDEMTLYSHDVKIYDSMGEEINLGNDYASIQNNHEALIHFRRAVMIHPTEVDLYNLGFEYERLGYLQKAKENYEKALAYDQYPMDQHTLLVESLSRRLAYVYLLLGQNEKARDFIKQQLRKSSKQGYLWEYLAISDYQLHNKNDALVALKKAKQYALGDETEMVYSEIISSKPIQFVQLAPLVIKNE